MTLGFLELASLFLFPVLVGVGGLAFLGIRPRDDGIAFLGWAYVLGALGTGAVLYVMAWLHVPFHAPGLAGFLAVVAVLLVFLGRRAVTPVEGVTMGAPNAPALERAAFLAVLLFLVLAVLARSASAVAHPVSGGDEASLWAFKAKLLVHVGGFGQAFEDQRLLTGARHHLDYPPLNPLLQLWAFAHEGAILHVENRFPIQAFGVALVLVLGAGLRRLVRPGLAAALLLGVMGCAPVWNLMGKANADTMALLGILVAADAWVRWRDTGERRWIALASVGLALGVASKHEGALHAVAFGAAVLLGGRLLARTRSPGTDAAPVFPRRALLWGALPLLAFAATWSVNLTHGFGNDIVTVTTSGREPEFLNCESAEEGRVPTRDFGGRLGFLAARFPGSFLLAPEENNLLLLAASVLVLAFPGRAFSREVRVLTLMLLLVYGASFLVYLRTPHELEWHWETSARRFLGQPLGAVALWIALFLRGIAPWAAARPRPSSPVVAPP